MPNTNQRFKQTRPARLPEHARRQGLKQISQHLSGVTWQGDTQFSVQLTLPSGTATYVARTQAGFAPFELSGPEYQKFFVRASDLHRAIRHLSREDWFPQRSVIPAGRTYCYASGTDSPRTVIAASPLLFPNAPRDDNGAALVSLPGLCPHLQINPFTEDGLGAGRCLLTGDRDHHPTDLLMDMVRSHSCPGRLPELT